MSAEPKPATKAAPAPSWWSPKMGILIAAIFAVLAGFPYISSAVRLWSGGKEVTMESVKKDAMQKEKEKMEHGHGEEAMKYREVRHVAVAADGTLYGGGKAGVFVFKNDTWKRMEDFPGDEVKSVFVGRTGTVWAAAKKAVYSYSDGVWTAAYTGAEPHSVAETADGTVYVPTKTGIMRRIKGGEWTPFTEGFPAVAAKNP